MIKQNLEPKNPNSPIKQKYRHSTAKFGFNLIIYNNNNQKCIFAFFLTIKTIHFIIKKNFFFFPNPNQSINFHDSKYTKYDNKKGN